MKCGRVNRGKPIRVRSWPKTNEAASLYEDDLPFGLALWKPVTPRPNSNVHDRQHQREAKISPVIMVKGSAQNDLIDITSLQASATSFLHTETCLGHGSHFEVHELIGR